MLALSLSYIDFTLENKEGHLFRRKSIQDGWSGNKWIQHSFANWGTKHFPMLPCRNATRLLHISKWALSLVRSFPRAQIDSTFWDNMSLARQPEKTHTPLGMCLHPTFPLPLSPAIHILKIQEEPWWIRLEVLYSQWPTDVYGNPTSRLWVHHQAPYPCN